jgi:hypothetical protein
MLKSSTIKELETFMKISFYTLAISLLLNFAHNPTFASTGTPAEKYKAGPVVYRSNNGNDYFFSTVAVEGPRVGYYPEEARFGLLPLGTPETNTLYRCAVTSKATEHFLSTDSRCEGRVVEGALGNLSSTPAEGLVALNRYTKSTNGSHIVILPTDKMDLNGWIFEGTLGYVTELQIPEVTQTPDDGKKYFSYYAGAMDGVGNGNYISELVDYSNLIFINSAMNLESKLAECEQRGIKAIVTVDWAFIDINFRLKPNYADIFASIEPILRRYDKTIVAFYGTDEPYTNSSHKGVNPAEVFYTQETMGRFLKSKFPNKPIGAIMTTDELKLGRPLFPSFDWWGFDCYAADLKCNGETVNFFYMKLATMMNELTVTDAKKRFIISVPQAGVPVRKFSKGSEKDIFAQLPYYLSISVNFPNVKVVMPFLWQSFDDGNSKWIGTRELPNARASFQVFYLNYTKGNQ